MRNRDDARQGSTRSDGIPSALVAVRGEGFERIEGTSEATCPVLDRPEWRARLTRIQQWRHQARVAQAENRTQQAIDEDFYDSIQYDSDDLAVMQERNQPPLVFNVVKNTINWILGTERKTRIDYRVLPRKSEGAGAAKAKTKLMKYVSDVNKAEFERSFAFEESVKAGLGWLEIGATGDKDCPIFIKAERWRNMWFDHLGMSSDGSDWRFQFRERWADLDVACSMFPEQGGALASLSASVNSIYPWLPDAATVIDDASEFDLESELDSMFGGSRYEGSRPRVKLVECWYRIPDRVKILRPLDKETPFGALDGAIFRPEQEDHQYLVRGGYFAAEERMTMTTRCAVFSGATYLQDVLSPYNHNRLPFVPVFCYRRRRDNMPYGVIRDVRDPQSDLNKRRSRSLFLLTANKVVYETGAINDPVKAYDEINRPDMLLEVNKGALVGGAIKFLDSAQLAKEHVEMARDNERFIESVSGVTPENKGVQRRDLSGKAIEALQAQGNTTAGVFMDNYFFAFQQVGEIMVSLMEQFFDVEDEYRITGDRNNDEFLKVNAPKEDGTIENPILKSKADFIISKQDFGATDRMQMFQTLSELIMGLAQSGMGQVGLNLLDLVIDMMDTLPNKEEIVGRIRKINGQYAPDADISPEEKAQREATEQENGAKQKMMDDLNMAMIKLAADLKAAQVDTEKAKASSTIMDSRVKALDSFIKAMETAGSVAMSPALATAADGLIQEAGDLAAGRDANVPMTPGPAMPPPPNAMPPEAGPSMAPPNAMPTPPEGGMMPVTEGPPPDAEPPM